MHIVKHINNTRAGADSLAELVKSKNNIVVVVVVAGLLHDVTNDNINSDNINSYDIKH